MKKYLPYIIGAFAVAVVVYLYMKSRKKTVTTSTTTTTTVNPASTTKAPIQTQLPDHNNMLRNDKIDPGGITTLLDPGTTMFTA